MAYLIAFIVVMACIASWFFFASKDDDDSVVTSKGVWLGGVTDHDLSKYEDPSYLEHNPGDDSKFEKL